MNTRSLLQSCSTRNDFGTLLNELGLLGEGVEIGVYEGDYSEILLGSWKGKCLHLVDPWCYMNDYYDGMNAQDYICEARMQKTIQRLEPWQGRFQIHRKPSSEAALEIEQGTLDFVYIDANHDYQHAAEDIRIWYPKLRSGGLLAGHDFCNETTSWYTCGVQSAVEEFVREKELELYLTQDAIISWFCLI